MTTKHKETTAPPKPRTVDEICADLRGPPTRKYVSRLFALQTR